MGRNIDKPVIANVPGERKELETMGFPQTYYVIPEHHTYLSDDRAELVFDQHLPNVRKDDLNLEVLEKSICLDFKAEGKEPVSRCYALPYDVDPSTAEADFDNNVLRVRARLRSPPFPGKKLSL
jgi:HSP20 family molecular chaperone IbpA